MGKVGARMGTYGVAVALAGCASAPMHDLMLGERAIAQALAAGAAQHAPTELALAREKLALGKRWIAARDYEPAKWLVEQALVDAELAVMKAASANAMQVAAQQAAALRQVSSRVAAGKGAGI